MTKLDLFPTHVYSHQCSLNVDDMYLKIKEFQLDNKSVVVSNRGGYQGHGFYYQPLVDEITKLLPVRQDKPEIKGRLEFWVNVNKQYQWNDIHDHNPYAGTMISGVYYVKTPPKCGRLRLFDPRWFTTNAPDLRYFNDGNSYHYFDPEPNLMILFPSWLKHDVEPNQSDEERISVAFNFVVDYNSITKLAVSRD